MKPDRFEILVCVSGLAVVAMVTTAAFGMAANERRIDPASNTDYAPAVTFASATSARTNNRFGETGLIRLSRESIFFVHPGPALR